MSHNRQWYTFKNEAGKIPELFIFDDIDDWFGVSAQSVVDQIRELDATDINVRINSRGGMVFEGIAIYNALRLHKANIHISIEGLAASIASVIAMAGDTVTISENAMLMIHNPYGWASGDAEAMRKTADVMDKIADSIAVSYTARTGKTLDEMKAMMEDETWFTAKEALEIGLVDQIDEPVKAAACFDLSVFDKAPEEFINFQASLQELSNEENTEQKPADEIETETPEEPENKSDNAHLVIAELCNKAGYSEKIASFLKAELSEKEVENQLAGFKEIKNLCKAANLSDKAKGFIDQDATVEDVRAELFNLLTKEEDSNSINNSLTPSQQNEKQTTSAIDTQAIYSKRNSLQNRV